MNYETGLRILIWLAEVSFLLSANRHFFLSVSFMKKVAALGKRWRQNGKKVLSGLPNLNFSKTRPKPAYSRQGLDWIVGLGKQTGTQARIDIIFCHSQTYYKEVMIFRYTHFLSLTGDPTGLLKGSNHFSLHTLFVTHGRIQPAC